MRTLKHGIATALLGSALLAVPALAEMEAKSAPDGAEVYFISPQDGDTVSGEVTVRMGLKGMGVAPAGLEAPDTGHHHLLIDTTVDEVDLEAPLPATDQTRHFGGGQTEARIELEPGEHRLQLLLLDHRHLSFDPPLASEVITVTVE